MDIGTGLALLGSAKLVQKLLGPTAEYIGEGIQAWAERRTNNVRRIIEKATRKLGADLDKSGAVPPKVLRGILSEGSFCDDELSAEYFGGVLAASRSDVERDDRGATLIAQLSRLSTYQIRTHYILYSILRKVYKDSGLDMKMDNRHMLHVFISEPTYLAAMDFNEKEEDLLESIYDDTFFGLVREGLIEDFQYGPRDELMEKYYFTVPDDGVVFKPTNLGSALFLWAHGYSHLTASAILDPDREFEIEQQIDIIDGYGEIDGYGRASLYQAMSSARP